MKTIIKLALYVCCFTFIACEKLTPDEIVYIYLNNLSSDTLNVSMVVKTQDNEKYDTIKQNKILKNITQLFTQINFHHYNSDKIRKDVFSTTITEFLKEKKMVITSLGGDTLANWNDNSVVFTDRNYWTIESRKRSTEDMDFDCTLNVTDEVLKLK